MRALRWLAALLLALPAVAGARVLVQDDGVQVTLEREVRCGDPVEVTVTSDRPDLFAADSPRLQSLFDATRALLGFECRNVPRIDVVGRLRGLTQPSYRASADAVRGWRLVPTQSVSVAATPAARSEPAPAPAAPPPAAPGRFAVRELSTGMDVDEAMRAARRGFDATPRYDDRRRELTVVTGSCEADATPRAGWVCMRALFSEGRDPRLYRLLYRQVVDQDQIEPIAAQLRQRFGAPEVDQELRSRSWLQGGEPERRLAWGADAPGDGEPRRELEARLRLDSGVTVLVLDLLDAGRGGAAPKFKVQF